MSIRVKSFKINMKSPRKVSSYLHKFKSNVEKMLQKVTISTVGYLNHRPKNFRIKNNAKRAKHDWSNLKMITFMMKCKPQLKTKLPNSLFKGWRYIFFEINSFTGDFPGKESESVNTFWQGQEYASVLLHV